LAGALLMIVAACGSSSTHRMGAAREHLVYLQGEGPSKTVARIADVSGGHSRSLGRASAAVLSPDGTTVALRRRDGIYLVSSSGRRLRRLTGRRLQPLAWSPDGTTIIATRPKLLAVLELEAIDRHTGRIRVIASGSIYGFSFSPKGDELAYARAPTATGEGLCGDQFDIYTTKLSGGAAKRLTNDGTSGFPVWGQAGIAFSHFPAGTSEQDCSAPGIWTMNADGSHVRPVIERAPENLASNDLFGLQPLAWLDDHEVLTGIRTAAGTLGAVVDTKTRKLRELHDFADEPSSDGQYEVGGGSNGDSSHLAIVRVSDGKRVFLRKNACCPDWNR